MKNINRREFLKLAGLTAGAAALAACGGAEEPAVEEPSTEGETTSEEPASEEAVTIQFWTFNDYAMGKPLELFNSFIASFEEANPNIKVNLTGKPGSDILAALLTGAASGDLPETIQIQLGVGGDLIEVGALQDVAPYYSNMSEEFQTQFNPGAMDPCKQEGKVWGLPFSAFAAILYRNLTVLQNAGVDTTNPPKDWAEFVSQMKACTASGVKGNGKFLGQDWCQFHYYGGVPGTAKVRINPDGKSSALIAEAYAKVFQLGLDTQEDVVGSFMFDTATADLFMTDQLGFVSMGPWLAPTLVEAEASKGLKWDAVEIPGETADWKGTVRGGEFTGMCPTKNNDAAWKWMSYVSDYPQEAEFAAGIGRLVANDRAMEVPEVKENWLVQLTYKAFVTGVDEALFMKKTATGFTQPEIDYGTQVDTLAMTPTDAAAAMIPEINSILAGG
jgi:multiple sugar transport system substrate-binding protein